MSNLDDRIVSINVTVDVEIARYSNWNTIHIRRRCFEEIRNPARSRNSANSIASIGEVKSISLSSGCGSIVRFPRFTSVWLGHRAFIGATGRDCK